ncbi:hypothetical protein [Luteimonas sp. YGD11-2]|nr:hypothetical protein [Luteimonas sp. YGD11-2]
MGGFDPWNGLVLLLLVAIPAAVILAMVWLLRRNRMRETPDQRSKGSVS